MFVTIVQSTTKPQVAKKETFVNWPNCHKNKRTKSTLVKLIERVMIKTSIKCSILIR